MLDADGKLHITDFGLARIEGELGMTMTGDILGTLRYMSPEQLAGESGVVDQRADIYSLGATFYELLTLRPAMDGKSREALLRQIHDHEPPAIRVLDPHVPRDLETILLNALSKQAGDRYPTAGEMATDLRRFLNREPIVARRPSVVDRVAKWTRRHRAVVAATIVTLLVTLTASTVLVTAAYQRERTALRQEQQQREIAEKFGRQAQENLQLARTAVDEMYTQIATDWVAPDQSVTTVQRRLLERALGIYEEWARDEGSRPDERQRVALASERSADIRFFLKEPNVAVEALRQAIDISAAQIEESPDEMEYWVALIRCHRKLATILEDSLRWEQALQACEEGLRNGQQLSERFGDSSPYELAVLHLTHGRLLLLAGKVDRAEAALERAGDCEEKVAYESQEEFLQGQVLELTLAHLQATTYRRQGDLKKSREMATAALGHWKKLDMASFRDAAAHLRIAADVHENLAQTLLAEEEPEQAVRHLRDALELRRTLLPGGRTPVEIQVAWAAGRDLAADINHPGIYAYARTQLKLGRVLRDLRRPYEAECMLSECWGAADILCHEDLATDAERVRHRVLVANCYAELAELLAERRPDESDLTLRLACARWHEVRTAFPEAASFGSGVHDGQSDWEWFAAMYPDAVLATSEQDLPLLRREFRNTVLEHHFRGRTWGLCGVWNAVLREFRQSADLREHSGAFDGFQVAITHHHLGNRDEAYAAYDAAVDLMNRDQEQAMTLEVFEELEELRQKTAELLGGSS